MNKPVLIPDSVSPLYVQLMTKLRADIIDGVYPVHSRIPSEPELCGIYGVSRVTVRKALAALTQEGLLKRHQGKGTFVSIPRIRRDLRDINSFHDICMMMRCTPSTELMHAALTAATADDREELMLSADQHQVVEIQRLRLADGMPVMLENNRFPESFQWLLAENLRSSLYATLRRHGFEPAKATHDISLCYATPQQARHLDVNAGDALLSLHEVIHDRSGRPLHISQQYIRGDRFTFRI